MKLSFLLLLASLSLAFATTCDPSNGVNALSPDCDSSSAPYCVLTVLGPPPAFECVQCLSSCDCSIGSYCSIQPGSVGKCKHFGKDGSGCRPLDGAQLIRADIPDKWKCAYLFTVSGNMTVDQAGVCIKGKCRQCNYRTSGGLPECEIDAGMGDERSCVYPGHLVNSHTFVWHDGSYYENPELVWWAIFFTFFVILMAVQVSTLVLTIRK